MASLEYPLEVRASFYESGCGQPRILDHALSGWGVRLVSYHPQKEVAQPGWWFTVAAETTQPEQMPW